MSDDNGPPDGPIPIPDDMRGRRVASKEITMLLRKTRKTLRLWERKGECPLGIPWPPGRRGSGNAVIYDLDRNWEAISTYLDIAFHHDRRWMHALSQATLKCADEHYSVLDELIAKEERELGEAENGSRNN